MKKYILLTTALIAGAAVSAAYVTADAQTKTAPAASSAAKFNAPAFDAEDRSLLLSLLERGPVSGPETRAQITARFDKSWVAPTLEVYNFVYDPTLRKLLLNELRQETGQDFGTNTNEWFRWLWNEPEVKAAGYDQFKADFYGEIDPKFTRYFEGRADTARIRLDEVRWGGVRQDGIPPLRNPKMIKASKRRLSRR